MTCDQEPSRFSTVTTFPFGIVNKILAFVDLEARRFKLTAVFAVVALGFTLGGVVGAGVVGVDVEGFFKYPLCTHPV